MGDWRTLRTPLARQEADERGLLSVEGRAVRAVSRRRIGSDVVLAEGLTLSDAGRVFREGIRCNLLNRA